MMRTLGCDRGASGSDLGRTSQARSAPSFAVARPAAELAHFDFIDVLYDIVSIGDQASGGYHAWTDPC
jgi:hypothetical protein